MVVKSVNGLSWLRKQIETADADLLREMVKAFAEALMGAGVDSLCGAGYGEVSPGRGVGTAGLARWRFRYPS